MNGCVKILLLFIVFFTFLKWSDSKQLKWYPQDGGNNLNNVFWGKKGDFVIWDLPHFNPLENFKKFNLPNPREVSNLLFNSPNGLSPKNPRNVTLMLSAWSQFLHNDIISTSITEETNSIHVPKCDPIFDINCNGDRNIPYNKTKVVPGTNLRINDVTVWLDASSIYGSSYELTEALRSYKNGRLLVSKKTPSNQGEYPPFVYELDKKYHSRFHSPNPFTHSNDLFACGDMRCNENPLVLSLHILFIREHNRVADLIKSKQPELSDDVIFSAARRYIIAEIQHITIKEYFFWLLGRNFPKDVSNYDPQIDPRINIFFSSVASRHFYSTFNDIIKTIDNKGINHFNEMKNYCFNPAKFITQSPTGFLSGMSTQIQDATDIIYDDVVRNFHVQAKDGKVLGKMDYLAKDLQLARDHGIPLCNEMRKVFGLSTLDSWAEFDLLNEHIGQEEVTLLQKIKKLYRTPNEADSYVCGIAENWVKNRETQVRNDFSNLGNLFEASIIDQFYRIASGDRFWYSRNLDNINLPYLQDIRDRTLSSIIRDNADYKVAIPELPFHVEAFDPFISPIRIQTNNNTQNEVLVAQLAAPGVSNWVPTISLPGGRACLLARGFPASPKTIIPWVSKFSIPPFSHPKPASTAFPFSAEFEGRKIEFHELHAVNQPIQLFTPGNPTNFFAYKIPGAAAGTVPGPVITACRGVQTLVRVRNFLEGLDTRFLNENPYVGNRAPGPDVCSPGFAAPWPISVHLHGSGSLAPYDGWADDVIFSGCAKDYLYPNNRAAVLWYHDHAVHVTSYNAYFGLASEYWLDDCCSEVEDTFPDGPYRLPFIVRDAVFDANDQLFMDQAGVHQHNLYGDHVLVNGIAWPTLHVERRQYRLAFLIASSARPFFFEFTDQPTSYFLVIGTEGGLRHNVIRTEKLRMGVGERYDVIIDFAQPAFANVVEVILYNLPQYNVPEFCQTNLVTKFIIDLPLTPTTFPARPAFTSNIFVPVHPVPQPLPPISPSPYNFPLDPIRPITEGLSINFLPQFQQTQPIPLIPMHQLAPPLIPDSFLALAEDPAVPPSRILQFRQAGGIWNIRSINVIGGAKVVIGGASQTWDSTYNTDNGTPLPVDQQWTALTGLPEHVTFDPTQNTLEVWELVNGGGGWFHPVHIHLVDFFLTFRKGGRADITLGVGPDGLAPYERLSPKDVVYMGPGEILRVVARYGPHGGNYMMHCHNLIHEDHDMMVAFRAIPGRLIFNPADPSHQIDLPADPVTPFDDPLSARAKTFALMPPVTVNYLASFLQLDLYRLIYPPEQAVQGYPIDWTLPPYNSASTFIPPFVNPWEVAYVKLDRPEMCPAFFLTRTPSPGQTSFYAQVSRTGVVGAVTGILSVDSTRIAEIINATAQQVTDQIQEATQTQTAQVTDPTQVQVRTNTNGLEALSPEVAQAVREIVNQISGNSQVKVITFNSEELK